MPKFPLSPSLGSDIQALWRFPAGGKGDAVVIDVTYRVGVGGFEVGDFSDGVDGCLCLRDQIAASIWVRDNIAAFGAMRLG